jgi:hypothetical protein
MKRIIAGLTLVTFTSAVPTLAGAARQATVLKIDGRTVSSYQSDYAEDECSYTALILEGREFTSKVNVGPPVVRQELYMVGYMYDCGTDTGYYFTSGDVPIDGLEFGPNESSASLETSVDVHLCSYSLYPEYSESCTDAVAVVDFTAVAVGELSTGEQHTHLELPDGSLLVRNIKQTGREAEHALARARRDLPLLVIASDSR